MKVEASVHQVAIRVYRDDDRHPDDFVATANFDLYGCKAWMYSINGRGFYEASADIIRVMEGYGVRIIEGYVTPAHARLLRRVLRGTGYECSEQEQGQMGGHDLVWVQIQREQGQGKLRMREVTK